MTVFKNNRSFDKPTKDNVIRQSKPNVIPYTWRPNAPVFKRTQPNERGTFFSIGSGEHSTTGVNE